MAEDRPDEKGRQPKDDVMQTALQRAAYSGPGVNPETLQLAEDRPGASPRAGGGDADYDEHEWDDVVQQTFPASDAPPPPGGGEGRRPKVP